MACITTTSTDAPRGSSQNPFCIRQGKQFCLVVTVTKANGSPFDLTGYTGRAQLRKQVADQGPPVATFTVTNDPTILNKATVKLGATITETLLVGKYVFDVEFENDVDPDDVIDGSNGPQNIEVKGEVTK